MIIMSGQLDQIMIYSQTKQSLLVVSVVIKETYSTLISLISGISLLYWVVGLNACTQFAIVQRFVSPSHTQNHDKAVNLMLTSCDFIKGSIYTSKAKTQTITHCEHTFLHTLYSKSLGINRSVNMHTNTQQLLNRQCHSFS